MTIDGYRGIVTHSYADSTHSVVRENESERIETIEIKVGEKQLTKGWPTDESE